MTIEAESEVVYKLIEFLTHHNFENFQPVPKPLPHCWLESIVDEYDYNFVKSMGDDMKIKLLKCTKSIGFLPLNHLICAFIAADYRGKLLKFWEILREFRRIKLV